MIGNAPIRAADSVLDIKWDFITSDIGRGIAWSPDGTHIAFGNPSENQVLILDLKTQSISKYINLPSNPDSVYFTLQWSSNGLYLAVVSSPKAYVFNTEDGRLVQTYSDFSKEDEKSLIIDARWINVSNTLSVLDANGYINLFNVLTGQVIKLIDLGENGESIFYSAFDWNDAIGLFAAPLYSTGTLGFWKLDGEIVATLVKSDPNTQNGLSSDCRILTLGGGTKSVTSIRWANEGSRVAVATELGITVCAFEDQMSAIKINDISVVQKNDTMPYPAPFLVTWSPDGRWLLSSSYPGPDYCWIKIFDSTQDYDLYQTIENKVCSIRYWQWSSDGTHLAAIAHDGLWIGSVQPR
jgi:WD40 repeat protein